MCVYKCIFFSVPFDGSPQKLCMFTILHAGHTAHVYFVSAIYQIGLCDTNFAFTFDTISI